MLVDFFFKLRRYEIPVSITEFLTLLEALERRVHLMRPSSIDPDMLDEQVRSVLGFAREGELIIYLDDGGTKD